MIATGQPIDAELQLQLAKANAADLQQQLDAARAELADRKERIETLELWISTRVDCREKAIEISPEYSGRGWWEKVEWILIGVLLLLSILSLAGCSADPAAEAAKQQAAAQQRIAEAQAADAAALRSMAAGQIKLDHLVAELSDFGVWYAALPADKRPTTLPSQRWAGEAQAAKADVAAAGQALGDNAGRLASASQSVDSLATTAQRAVKEKNQAIQEKNSAYHEKTVWTFVLGIVLLGSTVVVLWWTEKVKYAIGTALLGGGLLVASVIAGWVLAHIGLIVLGIVAAGIIFAAVEWIRHPNEGWESWIWNGVKTAQAKAASAIGGKA